MKTTWKKLGVLCGILVLTLSCGLPTAPVDSPSQPIAPAAQPAENGVDGASTATGVKIQTGAEVQLASQEFGPEGGTLTVDRPGDPLDGMKVIVPSGAYEEPSTLAVSYIPVTGSQLPKGVQAITPLVKLSPGKASAKSIFDLEFPLPPASTSDEHYILGFTYNQFSELLSSTVPAVILENGTVRVPIMQVDQLLMVVDGLKSDLDEFSSVNPTFQHGVHSWPFSNQATAISPRGQCAGQSLSALYNHWYNSRQPLYQPADDFNNPFRQTPELMFDDRAGIRLSAVLQTQYIDWGRPALQYWIDFQKGNHDEKTYYTLALAMLLTTQPQLLFLPKGDTGHAVVAYAKAKDTFLISDPNYPEPGAARRIIYNRKGKAFKQYLAGPTSSEDGVYYPNILFIDKYAVVPEAQLTTLWGLYKDGSIGKELFPQYAIAAIAVDAGGTLTLEQVTNPYSVTGSRVNLVMATIEPDMRVIVYDQNVNKVGDYAGNESFTLSLPPEGKAAFGFVVMQKKDGRWRWVDGRWINFNRSWSGSWDSGSRCATEFSFRWAVSLVQNDSGQIRGTVHFHDCPGGGSTIYEVTGQVDTAAEFLTLQGIKHSTGSALDKTTPDTQTFVIRRGQPPEPNFTP